MSRDETNSSPSPLHAWPASTFALVHWIEGGMGNANYWYRRVGRSARATAIAEEWQRIWEIVKTET